MKQLPQSQPSFQPVELNTDDIDTNALQIVDILQRRGFTTYLVGGCVRDLLLNRHPKDFDIATLARPQEVRKAIHNAFIIGKRFRLVLVKRGDIQYEVSTFRRDAGPEDTPEDISLGDNLFGSPEEDANRRDFTINALFYDPVDGKLIDFAKGLPDLEAGMVRMIGDPNVRLLEDPIRIMRAIRLAHMIRFSLEPDLKASIQTHAQSLSTTALPRRREEFLKYLRLENPALPFLTSLDLGVLDSISPTVSKILANPEKSQLFIPYLSAFHEKKLTTPTELFAGLILAVHLSNNGGEMKSNLKVHDILDNPAITQLMRDELGMFKSEQTSVAKALHLMTLFLKKTDFQSRGDRRRKAFVGSEAFPLALKLSEREHWLSPHDLHFWQEELKQHVSQNGSSTESGTSSSRRRRRRPRRGGPRPSARPIEQKSQPKKAFTEE